MNEESKKIIDEMEKVAEQETANLEQEDVVVKENGADDNKKNHIKKGHQLLVEKVNSTREKAENKHKEYLEANSKLDETTKLFLEHENKIVATTVADSLELLKSLNIDSLSKATKSIAQIEKENNEDLIKIKTPSKGIGKGLLFGILGAGITLIGAGVYGSKIAGLPLNLATFMQKVNLDSIASKYSELINLKDTPMAGYALVGLSSLAIGAIIYNIVTLLQKSKNIRYADKIQNDVDEFTQNLDNKIADTNALKEHTNNIESVMQKYDIILQEQNAKIRRMNFIEQPEDGVASLQKASKLEVEKTLLLLDELLELMDTPVNNGIKIREESKNRLNKANSIINEVIKKLYI